MDGAADRELGVIHHWVRRGALLYRVFLFENGLELDVGLIPQSEFGARGPGFRRVLGESVELAEPELAARLQLLLPA